jgi:hypothetical protein
VCVNIVARFVKFFVVGIVQSGNLLRCSLFARRSIASVAKTGESICTSNLFEPQLYFLSWKSFLLIIYLTIDSFLSHGSYFNLQNVYYKEQIWNTSRISHKKKTRKMKSAWLSVKKRNLVEVIHMSICDASNKRKADLRIWIQFLFKLLSFILSFDFYFEK